MTGSSFLKFIHRDRKQSGSDSVPPVLVIGAHRSGTTLVTNCLEKAGMFVGAELDPNNESCYFLKLNEWMLSQAGCRWDRPEGFCSVLGQKEILDNIIDQVDHMMQVPSAEEYLGKKPDSKSRGIFDLSESWGWKDPRNTITLPVWLNIFPDARVVHVYRHGVDVAASLVARSEAVMKNWTQKEKLFPTDMVTDSARCVSLNGAFRLWAFYMKAARSHTMCLGAHVKHVRYEEFISSPEEQFRELADFCGLSPEGRGVTEALGRINSDRAFAYKRNAGLNEFAASKSTELAAYGYEA